MKLWDQVYPLFGWVYVLFGSRSAILNIMLMINELDLFWLANFMVMEIYFIFGTKFSWNEGIDTCFNMKCVLLGRNFDFLAGYCSFFSSYYLLLITWWLLLVTTGYCSFPLLARTLFYVTHNSNGAYLVAAFVR